ncbi:unnamed protein product [Gadus morhua 'NCC']
MDMFGMWNSFFAQIQNKQIDQNVSGAQVGDLIEFVYPGTGLSLWAIYDGDGHAVHFGVGDENAMQALCRSFLHQMAPRTAGGPLRRTSIRRQLITQIKVPPGTRIRVNNNKHQLWPSPPELLQHRCQALLHHQLSYDLLHLNSEHFVTFVRYGRAVCTQTLYKTKDTEDEVATQTFQRMIPEMIPTESEL